MKNIINEISGSAPVSSTTGSTAYSVLNVPNFAKLNRYDRYNTNVNIPGGNYYLYLDRCNNVTAAGNGSFAGEDTGLAAYVSAFTDFQGTGPGYTRWTCHKAGIFVVDVSVVWDRQNTAALYGIAIEVNGVTTDLRGRSSHIHNLLDEWTINSTCTLAMRPNDTFKVSLFADATLNQLWEEPGTNRLTKLDLIQIA